MKRWGARGRRLGRRRRRRRRRCSSRRESSCARRRMAARATTNGGENDGESRGEGPAQALAVLLLAHRLPHGCKLGSAIVYLAKCQRAPSFCHAITDKKPKYSVAQRRAAGRTANLSKPQTAEESMTGWKTGTKGSVLSVPCSYQLNHPNMIMNSEGNASHTPFTPSTSPT